MADKLINNLPVVLQTTAIKNFFENTVEQLYSEANTISLAGFVGKKTGSDATLSGAFLSSLNPDRYHYALSPTINTINTVTGNSENLVFYDEFIDILDTYGVDVTNHNRLFEQQYKTFMPPIDIDKLVNFTEYFWSSTGPSTIDVAYNTPLNIDTDIIGQKSFTPTGGKKFRNGMIVQFIGNYTIPSNKTNIEYIVGGVGESIYLTPKNRSTATVYGGVKDDELDYLVVERGSYISSAWSRVNNWYHRENFLDAGDELPNKSYKAKRPIIEFNKDIEMFNYGSRNIGEVNILEPEFLKSEIEGLSNITLDNEPVANDMLIVFGNESNENKKYVYKVSGVGSSIVLSQEKELKEGDSFNIKGGDVYKGIDFIFKESAFREAQQKTGINQPPLFNLYNDNKIALNNTGNFFDSTFTGNKIFNYKVGTGQNDAVLGFPLGYSFFKSSSEIAFENYIETQRYTYYPFGATTPTEILGTYYYKLVKDVPEYHHTFKDSPKFSKQKVLTNYELNATDIAEERVLFDIGAKPNVNISEPSGYDIQVKLNNKKVTNFTYADNKIEFSTFAFNKGDILDIEVDSDEGIRLINNSRYSIPISWQCNSEDLDIQTIASPEYLPHFKKYLESQDGFEGDPLANNNFASIGKDISYADNIIKSSEDLDLGVFLLDDQQHNLIDALRFNNKEYNKFKNRLIAEATRYIEDLETVDLSADYILERVLRNVQSFSVGKKVFSSTYILPFGDNYILEEFDVADVDNYTYTLSNFADISKLENSVLVFYQRETDANPRLLLLDEDYTISETNPIEITILKDSITLDIGDTITTRLYNKDRDSAQCPPTPSAMGLYPLHQPRKETDTSYKDSIEVIVGHDGSKTPLLETQVDDVILEFERRIYNSCQKQFREANSLPIYNKTDIRSGYFRSTNFAWREYHDLLRQSFIIWNNINKSNFTINEFYDSADQWTWNYSGSNGLLPGHWRGFYEYYYDTVRPHTHPWEMLGFYEKPTWWETQYGTNYSNTNFDLWDDLEKGIIRQGARANVVGDEYLQNNNYARPGLSNLLPVDKDANLIPPAKITNTGSTSIEQLWNNRRVRANDVGDSFVDLSNTEFNQQPNGIQITVGSGTLDRIDWDEEGWDLVNRAYDGFTGSNVYIENSIINTKFMFPNFTFEDLGDDGLIIDQSVNGDAVKLPQGYIGVTTTGVPIVNPKSTTSYNDEGNWNLDSVYNNLTHEDGVFVITPEVVGLENWAVNEHSPIVGWAWDGLPIYGPYGYEYEASGNGQKVSDDIILIQSSFELKAGQRPQNPEGLYSGQFIEDYTYNSALSGTTRPDHHNKRYGVTPDSPTTPIWFYVATHSDADTPMFPYTIGGVKDLATDVTYEGEYYSAIDDYNMQYNPTGTVPVKGELQVLTSVASKNYVEKTGESISLPWKFGDGAPVENAWKYSSHYPFAVLEALLLAKPGKFATYFADPTNYIIPATEKFKLIHPVDRKKWNYKNPDHFRIHSTLDTNNNKITNSGYTQFISSWLEFQGLNMTTDFGDKLKTLNVKLAHRLEGFTDKDTLKVRTDQFSSTGTTNSLLIPAENFDIAIHNSPYKNRNFYSGVIVRKLANGYDVKGFDKDTGYFESFKLDTKGGNSAFELGGEPAPYVNWEPNTPYQAEVIVQYNDNFYKANSFVPSNATFITSMFTRLASLPQIGGIKGVIYHNALPEIIRTDYGTVFATYQEVVDFLVGLGKYQESLGFDFGGFDTAINDNRNWVYGAKQFIFWVAGGWQNNNTIELSPLANKVSFENAESFIAKINRIERSQFTLIDQNGIAIQPTECEIVRQNNRIEIVAPAETQIYGCMLFTKQIEHAMIIDNVTDFNDTIFNSLYNQKQNRLRLKGKKTANWTGRFSSEGFIIQGDELKPNLDNMAQSLGRYHELGFIPVEKQIYEKARGLFGYEEKAYLNDLELDDDTQFEFYSGMIREKGTTPSLSKIAKSNAIIQGNMTVYDEWALKIGDFGDLENDQAIELKLARSEIAQDPQLVTLAFPEDTTGCLDKINVVSTQHRYHKVPTIKIATPVSEPKVQAEAEAVLNANGEIESVKVTKKGSGYAEKIGINVIASEIIVDKTEHVFRSPVAQSNALANANLIGATLSNLVITDHNANTTLIPGGNITVDLSSATTYGNVASLINANPEFANSTLSASASTFEILDSSQNNIVQGIIRISGQDFTLTEDGSTLADLNLEEKRYQPKQRYSVLSFDQRVNGSGVETSNANVEVTIDGTVVSDSNWTYDHGSRTAIDFRVVGIQASQRVSPTGSVSENIVYSGNVTFNSQSSITNNQSFSISADNIVDRENIYDHLDIYINGQKLINLPNNKQYEFLSTSSFIIYNVENLPENKLQTGANVYIHEHSTVTFDENYSGDIPGKKLHITVNANDNLTSIVKSERIYTVTNDVVGDEVILIDIDDSKRFLKKPTGVKESGLWPTTNELDHTGLIPDKFKDIPNAGYVNKANVDYRAWRVQDVDRLYEDRLTFHPETGDLIHIANSENRDWNVYKIKKTNAEIEYIEMLPGADTTYLYTDKDLFEYSDFNQINDTDTGRFLDYHLVIKETDQNHKFCVWTNQDVVSAKQVRITNLRSLDFVEANVILAEPTPGTVHAISNIHPRSSTIFNADLRTISNNTIRVESVSNMPFFEGDQITLTAPNGNVNLGANVDGESYTISNVSGSQFTITLDSASFNNIANSDIGFGNGIIDAPNVMISLDTRTQITSIGHPFITGQRVGIEAGPYSGVWQVTRATANTFQIGARYVNNGPTTGNILQAGVTFTTDKDHGLDGYTGKIAIHNFNEWAHYNKLLQVTAAYGNVIHTSGIYPHGNSNIASKSAIVTPIDHDVIYPNRHKIKLDNIDSADGIADSFNQRMAFTRGATMYTGSFGMGFHMLSNPDALGKGVNLGGTPYAKMGQFDMKGLTQVGVNVRPGEVLDKKGFVGDKNVFAKPAMAVKSHKMSQAKPAYDSKGLRRAKPVPVPKNIVHDGTSLNQNKSRVGREGGKVINPWSEDFAVKGIQGAGMSEYTGLSINIPSIDEIINNFNQGNPAGYGQTMTFGGSEVLETNAVQENTVVDPVVTKTENAQQTQCNSTYKEGDYDPVTCKLYCDKYYNYPHFSPDPGPIPGQTCVGSGGTNQPGPTGSSDPYNPFWDPNAPGPAYPEPSKPASPTHVKPGPVGPILNANNPFANLPTACSIDPVDGTTPTEPPPPPPPPPERTEGAFKTVFESTDTNPGAVRAHLQHDPEVDAGEEFWLTVYTRGIAAGENVYVCFEFPLEGRLQNDGTVFPNDERRGFVPSYIHAHNITGTIPFETNGVLKSGYKRLSGQDIEYIKWQTPRVHSNGTVITDVGQTVFQTSKAELFDYSPNGDSPLRGGKELLDSTVQALDPAENNGYDGYIRFAIKVNEDDLPNTGSPTLGAVMNVRLFYDEGTEPRSAGTINSLTDLVGRTHYDTDPLSDGSDGNYYAPADLKDSLKYIIIRPKLESTPPPEGPTPYVTVTARTDNANDDTKALEGSDTITFTIEIENLDSVYWSELPNADFDPKIWFKLKNYANSTGITNTDYDTPVIVNAGNYENYIETDAAVADYKKGWLILTEENPTAQITVSIPQDSLVEDDEIIIMELTENGWFETPIADSNPITLVDTTPPPAEPTYTTWFTKFGNNTPEPPDYAGIAAGEWLFHIQTQNVPAGTILYIRDANDYFTGENAKPYTVNSAAEGRETITRVSIGVFPDTSGPLPAGPVWGMDYDTAVGMTYEELLELERAEGDPRLRTEYASGAGTYSQRKFYIEGQGDIYWMWDHGKYGDQKGNPNHANHVDMQFNGYTAVEVDGNGRATLGIQFIWTQADPEFDPGIWKVWDFDWESRRNNLALSVHTDTGTPSASQVTMGEITFTRSTYPEEVQAPPAQVIIDEKCDKYKRFYEFSGTDERGSLVSQETVSTFYQADCKGKITVTFYNWSVGDIINVYQVSGKQATGGTLIGSTKNATAINDQEKGILVKLGNNNTMTNFRNWSDLEIQPNGQVKGAGKFVIEFDPSAGEQLRVDLIKYSTYAMFYIDIPHVEGKSREDLDNDYGSGNIDEVGTGGQFPLVDPKILRGTGRKLPATPLLQTQGQVHNQRYSSFAGTDFKKYEGAAYMQNFSGYDTYPNAGHKYLPSALRSSSNFTHTRALNYGVYVPVTQTRYVSLTHQRVSDGLIVPLAPAIRTPIPMNARKIRSTTPYGSLLNSLTSSIANGKDILFNTPKPITIGLPEGVPVYADQFDPDEYITIRNEIQFEAPDLGDTTPYPGVDYPDPNAPANVSVDWTQNPVITIQPKVDDGTGVLIPKGKLAFASVYKPTPSVKVYRDQTIGLQPGDTILINGTPVEIKGEGWNGFVESLRCQDINGVVVDTVADTGTPYDWAKIQSCSQAPITFREGCSGRGQYKEILDFHIVKTFIRTMDQNKTDTNITERGTTYNPGYTVYQPVATNTDANGNLITANVTTTNTDANGNVIGTTTETVPQTTTFYKQVNYPATSGSTTNSTQHDSYTENYHTVFGGTGYYPGDRLRLVGGEPVSDPYSSIVKLCIENPGANYSYRGMIRIAIGDGTTPGRGAEVNKYTDSEIGVFEITSPAPSDPEYVALLKTQFVRLNYQESVNLITAVGNGSISTGAVELDIDTTPYTDSNGVSRYRNNYYEVKTDLMRWDHNENALDQFNKYFVKLPGLPQKIILDPVTGGIADVQLRYTEVVAGTQVCGVGYNANQPPRIIVQDLGTPTGLGTARAELSAVLTRKASSVPRVAKFEVTSVGPVGEINSLKVIDRGIYRQLPADLDSGLPLEYDYILEGDIDDGGYLRNVSPLSIDGSPSGQPVPKQPTGSGLGQWDPLNQYRELRTPSRVVRNILDAVDFSATNIANKISGTAYNDEYTWLGSQYNSASNPFNYSIANGTSGFLDFDPEEIVTTGTIASDQGYMGTRMSVPITVPPVNPDDDWASVQDGTKYGEIRWSSNTYIMDMVAGNGEQHSGQDYAMVIWLSGNPGGSPLGGGRNYIVMPQFNTNYYNKLQLINDIKYWQGTYSNQPFKTHVGDSAIGGGVAKAVDLINTADPGTPEIRFVNFALVHKNGTTFSDYNPSNGMGTGSQLRAEPGTAEFELFVEDPSIASVYSSSWSCLTRYPDSVSAGLQYIQANMGYDPNYNAFNGGKGARLYFTSREIPDCSEKGTAKQALGLPDITGDPNAAEELTDILNQGLIDAGHDPEDIRFETETVNDDVSVVTLQAPGYDGVEFGEATPGFLPALGLPIGDYNDAMACMVMTNETPVNDQNPVTYTEIQEGLEDGNGFAIQTSLKEEILTITCVDNMINPPGTIFGNADLQFVEDLYKYELRSIFNTPIESPLISQQASVNVLESMRYDTEYDIKIANRRGNWQSSQIPKNKDGFENVWIDRYLADSGNLALMPGFINQGWAYFENGTPKRWQKPLTDPSFVRDVLLYDSDTGEREYDLDKWDPFKGILPAFIDAEITYVNTNDPVVYNSARSKFSSDNCGQVWWDTSSIKYDWYEQGPNKERWKNWGSAFPGSTIRLYEWTESKQPPSQYTGTGTPKNASEYIAERRTDPLSGEKRNYYYFWVQNKQDLTTFARERHLRKFNTFDLAKYLSDPIGSGINTISFISSGNQTSDNDASFIVGNLPDIIREDEQNLQINLSRNLNPLGLKHVAWKMLREGDPDSIVPEDLSAKLIDSLCEQDATGQVVPAKNLSEVEKYGTAFRPRQTLFKYPAEARREMHYVLNEILADIKLETQHPKWSTVIPVGNYLEKTNWYKTIRKDATNNTVRYDDSYKSLYTVESVRALDSIKRDSLVDGAVIMVKGTVNDRYQLWRWNGKQLQFEIISIENETLKLNSKVYTDQMNPTLASDIRKLLENLRDNFFAGTNLWNKFFFNMLKYAYGEQPQIDWAFKTSYVYVSKEEEDLTLRQGFTPDNFDSVIEYLNEAKPYTAKVREYKDGKRTPIDYIKDQMISDFDKPPYPDPELGQIRILDDQSTADANILASDSEYVKWNSVVNIADNPIRKGNIKLVFDRVDWRLLPYDFDHSVNTYAQGTASLMAYLNSESNANISANSNISQAGRLFKFDPEVRTQFVEDIDAYKTNQNITSDISTNIPNLENAYLAGALVKTLELVKTKVGGGFRGEEIDSDYFTKVVQGTNSLDTQTGFGFDTQGFDNESFDSSIEVRNYEGILEGNTTLRRSGVTYDGFDSITFQKVLYGEERPEEMAMFSPLENLVMRVQTNVLAYGNGKSQPATAALALGPYPVSASNTSGGVVTVTSEYGRLLANTDSITFAGGSNAINQTFTISNVSHNYNGNVYSNTQFTIGLTGYTEDTSANITFSRGNTHVDVEYILHADMFGGEQYFRIKGDGSTKTILSQKVEAWDDLIYVQDSSKLPPALPGVPGVIWINGIERIEYREINTTTHAISKITRGTKGTTIQQHAQGSSVVSGYYTEDFDDDRNQFHASRNPDKAVWINLNMLSLTDVTNRTNNDGIAAWLQGDSVPPSGFDVRGWEFDPWDSV